MKRIISVLLLITMLFSMFVLTSCDFEKVLSDSIQIILDVDRIIDWIMGVRFTITEDEWNANMSIRNYSVDMFGQVMMKQTEQAVWSVDMEDEMLYIRKNGVEYELRKENGSWYAYPAPEGEMDYVGTSLFEKIFMDAPFEIEFEDLVFNESKKVYEFTYDDGEDEVVFQFAFKNGVITSIAVIYDDYVEGFNISDIGKTHIDIPEYTIVSDTTEEQ